MSKRSSTTDAFTHSQSARDPLQLLSDSLQDLILTKLAEAYGLSPGDLPSLYLAKSPLVYAGHKDGKSFMRFDLHVKEQERAPDVAIISLEFVVKTVNVIEGESC